jgi:hypothetical protein
MDEDELKEKIKKELEKDWIKNEWYTMSQIACKLKLETRTVRGWRKPGLRRKDGNGFIILRTLKISVNSSRGSWIVDFLVERNLYGNN